MKKSLLIILILIALFAFDFSGTDKTFKELYTLQGTWVMQGKRGPIYESWEKKSKHLLAGVSYVLRNKDSVINERIQLSCNKNGIWYTPAVVNQNDGQPVPFKLTQVQPGSYFFENPQHDFPKRIVYNLVGKDSLHVYIDEGTADGKQVNFNFKRQ